MYSIYIVRTNRIFIFKTEVNFIHTWFAVHVKMQSVEISNNSILYKFSQSWRVSLEGKKLLENFLLYTGFVFTGFTILSSTRCELTHSMVLKVNFSISLAEFIEQPGIKEI